MRERGRQGGGYHQLMAGGSAARMSATVTACAAAFFVPFAGWMLLGASDTWSDRVAGGVASTLVTGTGAVFAVRAARASAGRVRAAWAAMAGGMSAATVGEAIWAGRDVLQRELASPSIADALYLLFPVGMLAALILFPGGRGRQSQGRLVLDGVIMGGSLLIVSWLTVMHPAYTAGASSRAQWVVSLAYPLSNVVILTVATVVLARAGAGARLTLTLVTLGLLSMTLAESIFAYLSLGSGPLSGHHVIETGWTAGMVLIALGAAQGRYAVFDRGPDEAPGWASVWLPYAPLMLAGATISVQPRSAVNDRLVTVTGLVLILAVLMRQFLAVAESKRLVAAVTDLALHDPLTGLANRTLLGIELTRALQAPGADPVSVLVLDLDGFKLVNDQCGHSFGDKLLVAVAQRLQDHVDSAQTVARLGGDEFAVLLQVPAEAARVIAERISAAFDTPFLIDGRQILVGSSVGLAIGRPEDVTGEELLKRADLTMYASKRTRAGIGSSRETWRATDDTMLQELCRAVDESALNLVYQPKVALRTGEVVGVEALLRWSHPEHGLLLPGHFLPLVRSETLMAQITGLVLGLALDDAQRWREAGLNIPVAVNVFAPTMADLSLPDRVFAALEQRNLKPGALTVEMTEDLPMGRVGPTKSVLGELRHRGVRISIDDFGAGYPALSYLCHLPLDEIKLDRNFIGPHMSSSRVESVVRAAVTMGRELGLTVVAEGVRDADTAARLVDWGFDVAQGDFFGAPTPAAGVPGLTLAKPGHRGVAP